MTLIAKFSTHNLNINLMQCMTKKIRSQSLFPDSSRLPFFIVCSIQKQTERCCSPSVFSIACGEGRFSSTLYWKWYTCRMRSGDETTCHQHGSSFVFLHILTCDDATWKKFYTRKSLVLPPSDSKSVTTVITQMKYMIHSSTRNSILRTLLYGRIQLSYLKFRCQSQCNLSNLTVPVSTQNELVVACACLQFESECSWEDSLLEHLLSESLQITISGEVCRVYDLTHLPLEEFLGCMAVVVMTGL